MIQKLYFKFRENIRLGLNLFYLNKKAEMNKYQIAEDRNTVILKVPRTSYEASFPHGLYAHKIIYEI